MSTLTHPDEIDVDEPLVRRLIAHQFPRWAGLSLTRVSSSGTDNAIYRLGDDMAVRLPRMLRAAEMIGNEQRWLPRLAPLLPLAVPVPLGAGAPEDGFGYPWSVLRWLDGADLSVRGGVDLADVAARLGRFVAALQHIDTSGGPVSSRAEPVTTRDTADVRAAILHLAADGSLDADLASAVWDDALAAPAWDRPAVWIHGDLHPSNLLAVRGRLAAVIDFGLLGLGDPAADMLPAWTLLTAETREAFRAEAGVDEPTWVRGRGQALGFGLGAVRIHGATNPVLAAAGRHAIAETIADYQHTR